MTFKKVLSLSLVSILCATSLSFTSFGYADAQEAFSDLSSTHFNLEAIDALKEREVLKGYEDGTFRPENRINRAEMLKIIVADLYKQSEIDKCLTENPKSLFSDTPATEWYAPYVCIAKRDKIVGGYEDGTFKPGTYINFVELSKILTESFDLTAIQEVGGDWYDGYVHALEFQKAIPSTVEFFDEYVTRGEMSEMMWRLSDKITTKVSGTYAELSEQLPAVSSCEALVEKIKSNNSYYFYDDFVFDEEGFALDASDEITLSEKEEPALATVMSKNAAGMGGGGEEADDYSSTNVQTEGVDEADIVKNDGKYIYLLKGNKIKIVQAYPALAMSEASSTTLGEEGEFYPDQMFLNGDQLIIIGYNFGGFIPYLQGEKMVPATDASLYSEQTIIYTLDISDRTEPKMQRRIAVDGTYNTARKIGDNMYVVLNQYVDYYYVDEENPNGDRFLPQIQTGDEEPVNLVECTGIHYLPGHDSPSLTEIISFDLAEVNSEVNSEVILGNPNSVYMSLHNLYVTQRNYDYAHFTDWDDGLEETNSDIFKFELEGPTLDFTSRANVPGYVMNQFSMDEANGYFRIATTTDRNWQTDTPSSNAVYIFDENMKQTGSLINLAKGETIYSTRFLGDRLYMVTYKQVDPLFVIDLTDPTQPSVLGELKIPGYSTYLHPYDENHIIGFGEDVLDPDAPADPENPAWRQGFKMALFDVTDPTKPVQQYSESIGDRGTSSELLYNHKALMFDQTTGLMAFPIDVAEVKNSSTLDEDALNWAYGDTVFQGAYVYKLDLENGFQFQGRLTHYDSLDLTEYGINYNSNKEISRIVRMDDILYTISEGLITAVNKDTVKAITSLILE